MKAEERIRELGIDLPVSSPPGAMYIPVTRIGDALFVAGQIPARDGVPVYTGKLGSQRDLEYGQEAARLCAINLLAALRAYLGDLDHIHSFAKLQVFVASEVGFDKQHLVANAASDLLYDVFGERGRHARTAVGVNQLPLDVTVEIEAIVKVREGV